MGGWGASWCKTIAACSFDDAVAADYLLTGNTFSSTDDYAASTTCIAPANPANGACATALHLDYPDRDLNASISCFGLLPTSLFSTRLTKVCLAVGAISADADTCSPGCPLYSGNTCTPTCASGYQSCGTTRCVKGCVTEVATW